MQASSVGLAEQRVGAHVDPVRLHCDGQFTSFGPAQAFAHERRPASHEQDGSALHDAWHRAAQWVRSHVLAE